MVKCGYCGSTIVMGGVRSGDQRFCNNKCFQSASILSVTKGVPPAVLDQKVEEIWHGLCPKCRGMGPIDVHKTYQVWSMLVLTRWTTKSQASCRSCATKGQLGGAAFSLLCGWWGFPWGLILTPLQVTRNFMGICRGPDPLRPSDQLRKLVLVNLGSQIIARQKAAAAQSPPSK